MFAVLTTPTTVKFTQIQLTPGVVTLHTTPLYKIIKEETVTIPEYPIVQEIKDFMMEQGAVNAMMSGSGPTVFGLYTNQIQAEKACEKLRDAGLAKMVFLTTFIGKNPYA